MEDDEKDFIKSDYNTYNEERTFDSCLYCGTEDEDLNILSYEISPDCDIHILGVNILPHQKINIQEGWIKRIEVICDECLKEEYNI